MHCKSAFVVHVYELDRNRVCCWMQWVIDQPLRPVRNGGKLGPDGEHYRQFLHPYRELHQRNSGGNQLLLRRLSGTDLHRQLYGIAEFRIRLLRVEWHRFLLGGIGDRNDILCHYLEFFAYRNLLLFYSSPDRGNLVRTGYHERERESAMKLFLLIAVLFPLSAVAQNAAVNPVQLHITNPDSLHIPGATVNIYRSATTCPSGLPQNPVAIQTNLAILGTVTYYDSTVAAGLTYCYYAVVKVGGQFETTNTYQVVAQLETSTLIATP